MKFTSHKLLPRSQQRGMLLLVLFVGGLITASSYIRFERESILDTTSAEVVEAQRQIDSLRMIAKDASAPKIYPFNPNFISDYRAYVLGLSTEEFDALQAFRKQGKWINSAQQFQHVTGVSDSLLAAIAPFFKFPEWVSRPRTSRMRAQLDRALPAHLKIDLNTATVSQLQEVYGIGPALSNRIVAFRTQIGGFSDERQLYLVWGLSDSVVAKVLNRFTVKNPTPISKLNINTASASDLATLPGISFETAREVWEFRRLREHLTNLSELEKIEGLTARELRVFQLYLSVE